jgi:hypothetical protein
VKRAFALGTHAPEFLHVDRVQLTSAHRIGPIPHVLNLSGPCDTLAPLP